MPAVCFDSTIELVGIEFFSFLSPNDLASLRCCSKQLLNDTRQHIFNVCMQQLPLRDEDDESTDTLNIYKGDQLAFPASKDLFLSEIVGLLHSNGVRIDTPVLSLQGGNGGDDSEVEAEPILEEHSTNQHPVANDVDQIELLKKSSYVKLVSDDGFTAHFSLGFKQTAFKKKHLARLHAMKFMDDLYLLGENEERLLVKQWVYLLISLNYVSIATWHAMFIFEEQTGPIGGAGILLTNDQTGETIEVVRRMSKETDVSSEEVLDGFSQADGLGEVLALFWQALDIVDSAVVAA
jgi:hypothetical protein